ncbi:hypothetical protein ACTFIW_010672 [Dictyostelium discoideum]
MNLEQIQAIVAKNDDSAARHIYYKELVLGAARKITAKGAGILNYISVFEANYKQLHIGLSSHALVDEFIFFLPGDIKELLRTKAEEEKIAVTKEYATVKERVLSEDMTRKRTLEINNNNNAVLNVINNVKNNGKLNNVKNSFRVEGSTSTDQAWFEMNKVKILKLLQEVKVPAVVENSTTAPNPTTTTTTTINNSTPSSGKIAGKCFNCNKVGHRAVDCRSKPKSASTNSN